MTVVEHPMKLDVRHTLNIMDQRIVAAGQGILKLAEAMEAMLTAVKENDSRIKQLEVTNGVTMDIVKTTREDCGEKAEIDELYELNDDNRTDIEELRADYAELKRSIVRLTTKPHIAETYVLQEKNGRLELVRG